MNGVGLTTVGRLLGHRKRATTAIYAHLDDAALRDAAAQAAAVIARAMGYRAETPSLTVEAMAADGELDGADGGKMQASPPVPQASARPEARWHGLDWTQVKTSADSSTGSGSVSR